MSAHGSLFWISFIGWLLLEAWVALRPAESAAAGGADRRTRTLILICAGLGVAVLFYAPAGWPEVRLPPPVVYIGCALAWAGIGLRLWAILTLGRFFRTRVHIEDGHRLVTRGPYRVLRHPAYTGSLLTFLGLGLMTGNGVAAAAAPAMLVFSYVFRITVEEGALQAQFGDDFTLYRKRTWALLPPIW